MNLRSTLAIVAAAFAAAATAATPAAAGTYEVLSCSAAGGTNLSWTFETNAPDGIRFTDRCTSAEEDDADVFNTFAWALGIRTKFGAADMPVGTYGYLRFDVPEGLTITGWRRASTQHIGDPNWNMVLATSAGDYGYDDPFGSGSTPGPVEMSALSPFTASRWLRIGFRCTEAPCSPGASAHSAATRLYGAAVQVTDSVLPSVALSGAESGVATVTGADQTGIRRLELLVDGISAGVADQACDYRRVLPCASPGGPVSAEFTLPTLSPGAHTFEARATDAAGNVGSTSGSVQVDEPQPPVIEPPAPPGDRPAPGGPVPPGDGGGQGPGAGGQQGGAPVLRSARLKLRVVRRSGSLVRVRGQVAEGCRSRITVRVTARGRTKTVRLRAPRSGRWGTTVRGVRRGGKAVVRVSAAKNSVCRSASIRRR